MIRWSREDPTANARRGQQGLLRRFEKQVDPEGALDPEERQRRAECLRRAHMIELAQRAHAARAARKAPAPDVDTA